MCNLLPYVTPVANTLCARMFQTILLAEKCSLRPAIAIRKASEKLSRSH